MVIAGEASGDLHGARLVKAMRALNPNLDFFGIGGSAMREAGVDVRVDNAAIAVVGFSEAFFKIRVLLTALRQARNDLKQFHPVLLILIDFPDFNLHMAGAAKRLGIPVLYYISPQVWAWRRNRVKKIKRLVDHMIVIFPFEVDFYRKWNVPVTFVGHPLLDSVKSRHTVITNRYWEREQILVGLLPGSRKEEVARLLPAMVGAAEILAEQVEGVCFAIPVAPSVRLEDVETMVRGAKADFSISRDGVQDILDRAVLVVTASGTVTLEAAIAGTPMIIVYKMSPLSYWLARLLIRVRHIGLANLVAGKRVVPELIQHEASAEKIAAQALKMMQNQGGLESTRLELHQVAQKLGEPGASKRAARVALALLSKAADRTEKHAREQ